MSRIKRNQAFGEFDPYDGSSYSSTEVKETISRRNKMIFSQPDTPDQVSYQYIRPGLIENGNLTDSPFLLGSITFPADKNGNPRGPLTVDPSLELKYDIPEVMIYNKMVVGKTHYFDMFRGMGRSQATDLALYFFSERNVMNVRVGICRQLIFESKGKFRVPLQDEMDCLICMRNIFKEYSEHKQYNKLEQIQELNNRTINRVVPGIHSNCKLFDENRNNYSHVKYTDNTIPTHGRGW